MTFARTISGFSLALVAGVPAMACEPTPYPPKDPRIKTAADCSFTEAQYGYKGPFYGGPAVKVGNGKVAQKLVAVFDSGLCGVEHESLLVIDCESGQDVVFDGRPREEHADSDTEIKAIQPPKGPIALTKSAELAGLIRAAKGAGIGYRRNEIRALAASAKPRNRFDPYCGCKLHYPDSEGAK